MAASRPPVIIIGAGIAGLSAARELGRYGIPVRLYEAGKQVAGLATTYRDEEGFTYDFGAHFITNRLAAALGVSALCHDVRRYGETVVLGTRTYGFPFGLVRSPRFVASALASRLRPRRPSESAAEWYRAAYGARLADLVAIPLVEAWSGVPATDLAPSVIPPQVDRGTLHVMKLKIAAAITGRAVANGYSRTQPESIHVWHVYPEGSVGAVCQHLARDLDGALQLESRVEAILVEDGRAVGIRVNGEDVAASAVVSTAPVHILAKIVRGTDALAPLARFRYRPMTLVNMRLRGRGLLPDVVTWTPEARFPFFRLTEVPLSMPWLAPEGKTTLSIDIGCEVGDAIWTMADEALGQLCLERLEPIIRDVRRRFISCHVLRTPIAHPVYLREYEQDRVTFERTLPVAGLYSIGRNGEFAHILMEDVYWRTVARMRDLARAWYAFRS